MLRQLFARWGRQTSSGVSGAEPSPAGSADPPAVVPRTGAADLGQPWRLVSRRPLLDRSGGIAGWDLRQSPWAAERLRRTPVSRPLHEAFDFALAQAARTVMQASRIAVLNLPAATLRVTPVLAQLPAGAIVAIDDATVSALGAEAPAVLSILRESRLKLALAPRQAGRDPSPEFVIVDASSDGAAQALRDHAARVNAREGCIVTNLRSFEDVTAALANGVDYACGAFAQAVTARSGQASAQAVAVANLVSALIAGKSPREIAELFKAEVTLSYRLMRITGSAAFGLGRPIGSLQEAVMLLGTRELYRWLCALLLTSQTGLPLAGALHETALTRGRLLELVAIARGRADPPEALFVTGAFSLLDLLLNVPLETALALMPLLPEPTIDALIAESGPWRPYLELALAMEAGEDRQLEAACAGLELNPEKAAALYADAADWAAGAAHAAAQ